MSGSWHLLCAVMLLVVARVLFVDCNGVYNAGCGVAGDFGVAGVVRVVCWVLCGVCCCVLVVVWWLLVGVCCLLAGV